MILGASYAFAVFHPGFCFPGTSFGTKDFEKVAKESVSVVGTKYERTVSGRQLGASVGIDTTPNTRQSGPARI
jgi:hypothetical protein